ncbi:hypothetical protein UFOVP372_33 [uncultured Caudovirales phage]|uniref:Uncharacterized protein n=1 Tax=uncultured Caudovirales phage TaxID=2100421 RepID=A0A6J7X6A5_9CAUD|nr:hypothetical protein UFOVP372_33 [uncultured Caudovirales phage]
MAEMTLDQQRAMAMAAARARAAQAETSAAPSGDIPGPRRSYSMTEVPVEAVKNLPESAGKFVGGVVQAITSPLQTLTGILDAGAGALRNSLPQGVVNFVERFDTDPQATQRAVQTANAIGGMYKDRYGSYEGIKRTFAEDPVGAAADLSTLLTGGGAAATKLGATQTGAALSRGGAAINPMRPIAPLIEQPIKLAAKGVGAVYNALDPKSAAYLTAVEGRGPQVLNALRQPSELVPGSLPTAAEAASSVGATRFSAMGESARKTLSTPFFERGEGNKAAQVGAVRQVGQTADDLAAAEAIRKATAKDLYGISDKAMVAADDTFSSLLGRPSMDKVLGRASDLAAEKGQSFQIGQNRPSQVVPSSIVDEAGRPMGQTVIPGEVAKYPGSSLHSMKLAFDDLIKNPERFGIGASEVGAIKGTRAQFLNWVESKAPSYRTARETFADQSKPINQMAVGQYLEGKLTPALGEETARLRASGFATALENAPGTIKRATGESRFQNLSDVLTPEQINILENVRADLARAQLTERQAGAARGAGPDVNLMGTEVMGSVRAPNFINNVTTVANDLLRRMQGKLDQKLAIELATEMLDPAAAAAALEKALARQAKGQKMADPFAKTGKAASKVLRTPAAVNMLAPASEIQNSLISFEPLAME